MTQTEIHEFKPSVWKIALLIVVGPLLIWLGFWGIEGGYAGGWIPLGIGLMAIPAAVMLLIPGATLLRLDPQGLTLRGNFRERFIAWGQFESFEIVRASERRHTIAYRLAASAGSQVDRPPFWKRLLAPDYDGVIPPYFNISDAALYDLLTDMLRRHKSPADGAVSASKPTAPPHRSKRSIWMILGVLALAIIASFFLMTADESTGPVAVKSPKKSPKATEGSVTIHLQNGKVLSGERIRRESGGLWLSVEGGEVFFTAGEVKKVEPEGVGI